MVDPDALTALWDTRWPGCSKVPYELKQAGDHWVRFHTLPGSQRYPRTEAEYQVVLARHNEVLTELITEPAVLVITAGYDATPSPPPGTTFWTTPPVSDGRMHLYVRRTPWSAGCLDPLLRQVADDEIANVVVTDPGLRWLHHPYDGGMDVLLPSSTERDALRDRHRDWLSARRDGL